MDISYRREMNHNYMIITPEEEAEDGYEARMLSGNQIEGLLKFRIRHWEDKKEYYYEITSRQPLSRLLDRKKIRGDEIRKLLLGIAATLNRIEDYLLKEEHILLEPEYLYIEPDTFSSGLCLIPEYDSDFPTQFTGLLQYLLEKVDHQDKDGVILAYNLYHESLKENYGMVDLLRLLSPETLSDKADKERRKNEKLPFPDTGEENEDSGEEQFHDTYEREDDRGFKQSVEGSAVCQSGGIEKGQDQTEIYRKKVLWIKGVLVIAAVEAVIWFLAGEEALLQYGVAAGAATAAIILVFSFLGGRKQTEQVWKNEILKEERREAAKEKMRTSQREAPREKWDIIAEPELIEKKKEEIFEQEADEIETALLGEKKNGEKLAILESIDRDQESIAISYVPFVIGKHEELSDYCLRHPTVSRLHLRLDRRENVFIVTDLNSTNGTTVENYQLQSNETVSIKNGDRLCLADLEYRFWEK